MIVINKTIKTMILVGVLSASACRTSPAPVPDRYIVGASVETMEQLENLEAKIIQARKSKKESTHDVEIAKQAIKVIEAKRTLLQSEKIYIYQEEELYTLTEDAAKLASVHVKKEQNAKNIELNQNLINYRKLQLTNAEINLDLRDTELRSFVAEREWIRAKVAHAYLEKKSNEEGTSSSVKEKSIFLQSKDYDVSSYESYHLEIQEKLKSIHESLKSIESKLAVHRENLEENADL